jgi:hypothetical protein
MPLSITPGSSIIASPDFDATIPREAVVVRVTYHLLGQPLLLVEDREVTVAPAPLLYPEQRVSKPAFGRLLPHHVQPLAELRLWVKLRKSNGSSAQSG